MNLKFVNSQTEMILGKRFIPSISEYERRVNTQDRFGKDGAVPTGDQMVDSRKIKMDFNPIAEDDTTYLSTVNAIITFFNLSLAPFYLVDTDTDRRCQIVLVSAEDEAETEGVERRHGKNRLEFQMLDGHWEDEVANFVYSETGGIISGGQIVVDNDSGIDSYPIFRISPSLPNSSFTIRNITTGALFTIGSNSFVPGTELIIDCQNGTIYLSVAGSMIELSSALADGSGFIKFVPGENSIEYTSAYGEADIEIEYRRRYAF